MLFVISRRQRLSAECVGYPEINGLATAKQRKRFALSTWLPDARAKRKHGLQYIPGTILLRGADNSPGHSLR